MDICPTCMGTGLEQGPTRMTRNDAPQKAVLSLLTPCSPCEGRGVLAPRQDRDYALA